MRTQSSVDIINNHTNSVNSEVEYLWHDKIRYIDEISTISANAKMKAMYNDEQEVTTLVINDMNQEMDNLSSIAEVFKYVDKYLSGYLNSL